MLPEKLLFRKSFRHTRFFIHFLPSLSIFRKLINLRENVILYNLFYHFGYAVQTIGKLFGKVAVSVFQRRKFLRISVEMEKFLASLIPSLQNL